MYNLKEFHYFSNHHRPLTIDERVINTCVFINAMHYTWLWLLTPHLNDMGRKASSCIETSSTSESLLAINVKELIAAPPPVCSWYTLITSSCSFLFLVPCSFQGFGSFITIDSLSIFWDSISSDQIVINQLEVWDCEKDSIYWIPCIPDYWSLYYSVIISWYFYSLWSTFNPSHVSPS